MTGSSSRQDRSVEAAVRARLDHDEDAHLHALARYEVVVLDGRATLTGHVRSRHAARAMVALAGGIRTVSSVDDQLVADDELVQQVASAIGRSASNRASRLVVRAEFGRVRVGGIYPSPQAHADALRVAADVPGVLAATPTRPSDLLA